MSELSASLPPPPSRPRNGRAHGLPIFLLALLIGVGAHIAVLTVFSLHVTPPMPPEAPPSSVNFYARAGDAEQDKLMREEAEIFDPRNIYLPVSHNNSARDVGTTPPLQPLVFKADAGQALPSHDDERGNFHLLGSSGNQAATPGDALKPAPWTFMNALGMAPNTGVPLPAHGAQLRIVPEQSGPGTAGVRNVTWAADMAPKAGNAQWQPARFSILFTNIGMIGEPVMLKSTGVSAVDDDLRAKLKDWFGHHPLPPGSYSVEIGP